MRDIEIDTRKQQIRERIWALLEAEHAVPSACTVASPPSTALTKPQTGWRSYPSGNAPRLSKPCPTVPSYPYENAH
jgi:hypothetical protein